MISIHTELCQTQSKHSARGKPCQSYSEHGRNEVALYIKMFSALPGHKSVLAK